jgi:tellurium resistance protein TerD
MAINLEKGGRINLSKDVPALKRVRMGLGWDANAFDTGKDFDLDASVFLCKADANGHAKLISDAHFVFYGNLTSPDGAVAHKGDSRTGVATGDDENIIVDLKKIAPDIEEMSFIVTIHEAAERRQNFGQVKNSYIKLYDDETGKEVAKYSLEEDFSTETAVQFGSLYKKDGAWLFKAVGAGYKKGLADFVVAYGGNLA